MRYVSCYHVNVNAETSLAFKLLQDLLLSHDFCQYYVMQVKHFFSFLLFKVQDSVNGEW